MCAFVCDGSCRSSPASAIPGPGDLLEVIGQAVWAIFARVLLPIAALLTIGVVKVLAGQPLTPHGRRLRRTSGATWLRSGAKVHRTRTAIYWYAFPGWQRSVASLALVALLALAWWAPLWTALAVAVTTAALAVTATTRSVRRRQAARQVGPRKVKAVVGDPARPAIAPEAARRAEAWFSILKQKVKVSS